MEMALGSMGEEHCECAEEVVHRNCSVKVTGNEKESACEEAKEYKKGGVEEGVERWALSEMIVTKEHADKERRKE